MAKILLRVSDGRRGHFSYDPVSVINDDANFGRLECLETWTAEGNSAESWPKRGVFVTLSVPGVAADTLKYLKEEETAVVERDNVDGVRVRGTITLRARRHSIDLASMGLSAADLNKRNTGGEILVSQAKLESGIAQKLPDVAFKAATFNAIKARNPTAVLVDG